MNITYSDSNLIAFTETLKVAVDYLGNIELPSLQNTPVTSNQSILDHVREFFNPYHEYDKQERSIRLLEEAHHRLEVLLIVCSNSSYSATSIEISARDSFLVYHYALKSSVCKPSL